MHYYTYVYYTVLYCLLRSRTNSGAAGLADVERSSHGHGSVGRVPPRNAEPASEARAARRPPFPSSPPGGAAGDVGVLGGGGRTWWLVWGWGMGKGGKGGGEVCGGVEK